MLDCSTVLGSGKSSFPSALIDRKLLSAIGLWLKTHVGLNARFRLVHLDDRFVVVDGQEIPLGDLEKFGLELEDWSLPPPRRGLVKLPTTQTSPQISGSVDCEATPEGLIGPIPCDEGGVAVDSRVGEAVYVQFTALASAETVAFIDRLNAQLRQEGLHRFGRGVFASIDEIAELHKRASIVFFDYFNKWLVPPAGFSKLLNRLNLPISLFSAELQSFKVFLCSSTNQLVVIPQLRALGWGSPAKAYPGIKSSASRLVSGLTALDENGKADYLMCLDLTFPSEISSLLAQLGVVRDDRSGQLPDLVQPPVNLSVSNLDKIIDQTKRCVSVFKEKLEKSFYGGDSLCFHFNIHPSKTHSPCEPHLHVHVNFPNCVKNKKGELIRIQPYFAKDESEKNKAAFSLDDLRKLWWGSIKEVFGLVVPVENLDVVIHYNYIPLKNRPRLVHRIKYCARRPVSDFFQHYREDVCPPHLIGFVLRLLSYSNRRYHLGWTIGTMVSVQREPKCVCPLCFAPAERIALSEFDPKSAYLVVWNGGWWEVFKPP